MVDGTPIDRDKMAGIGIISRRTRTRIQEGREHPDSGRPFKTTVVDDAGSTVTEHSAPGAAPGVSDRQDVDIHPTPVVMKLGVNGHGMD